MADHDVVCSMRRSGNVWDNAVMESFFFSLKTERTAHKTYRTHDEAKDDVFDYIECFYNVKRRHSTIGYMSPMEFEMRYYGANATSPRKQPIVVRVCLAKSLGRSDASNMRIAAATRAMSARA
jgi:Integrase core domain